MHGADIYYVVVTLANAGAAIAFWRSWLNRRDEKAGQHAEQVQALTTNTVAVQDLTGEVKHITSTLADHDLRINKLEWERDLKRR